MIHRDVSMILFFHEAGTGGDTVLKALDNSSLSGRKISTTHDFEAQEDGRSNPGYKKEYRDLLDDPSVYLSHTDTGKDLSLVQRWLTHAQTKNEIPIIRMRKDWDTVVNIQKSFEKTYTITMDVPKNMHQCVLKARHKVVSESDRWNYDPLSHRYNDPDFEKLKHLEPKKALSVLYEKMWANEEKVSFDDRVKEYNQADYLCSIENLHTDNFIDTLSADLGITIDRSMVTFHSDWLARQSPLYRFDLSQGTVFRDCFGFNSKAPGSAESFDLDPLDKAFLTHYQRTNKLPPVPDVNTTNDVVTYFKSII